MLGFHEEKKAVCFFGLLIRYVHLHVKLIYLQGQTEKLKQKATFV